MKKLLLSLIFLLMMMGVGWSQPFQPGLVNVTEPDGSPDSWVYKFIFPNGSVSVSANVATVGAGAGVIANGATADLTSGDMAGQWHRVTGAYTLSLPTAVAGYNACFVATTAAVFSLDLVTGTDLIILNGTSLTAGYKATSDGSINATICVISTATGAYRAYSLLGVFADGGA